MDREERLMVTQDLHVLARVRLDAGELPLNTPQLLLGANGSGARCALCDVPITSREIEYDIELAGSSCFRFHIRCHDAWRDVRDELQLTSISRSPTAPRAATADARPRD
jgi:hypothetical protein